MRNKYLYITLLSIIGFGTESLAQVPRLVVSINIDQLSTDRLENYAPAYTSDGLRRLLAEGLQYTTVFHDFVPVDEASATASIATGTTPYYNSITGREWFDRTTLRPQRIIADSQYSQSPIMLATSTIGDELKLATQGSAHVYAFASTAESAILSAGHAADGVAWMSKDRWQTTGYYTPQDAWLKSFIRQYIPTEDVNKSIAGIAVTCINQSNLGLDEEPDLLSLTLTAGSNMDSYLALDITISYLINSICQRIPLERVLFVITGTGTREEEQENEHERYRIPTGKVDTGRTANLLNLYLGAVYGPAQYIEGTYGNQFYLNHKLLLKKNIEIADALRRAQEFLSQISGIRNVYTVSQLLTTDTPLLHRIRNGFNIEHCGDLLIDIQPGWQLINEDNQTSTFSRLGTMSFPVIFFGAGIQAGRITQPVSADRIAPTISKAIRIRAPNACAAEPLF